MTVSRAASGVTVLALSGLALLGVASPASAHHRPGHNGGPGSNCPNPAGKYPPGQCNPQSASVNDSSLTPGAPVTYRAQGYMPGAPVVITLFSTPVKLGTATADSFSFVSKALMIPMGTALGSHKLVSTGLGANGRSLTLEVPIVVSQGAATVSNAGGNGTTGVGVGANGRALTLEVPIVVSQGAAPVSNAGGNGTTGVGGVSTGGTGTASGSGLPRTGVEIALATAVGAGLLGAGTVVARAGRRRRTQTA